MKEQKKEKRQIIELDNQTAAMQNARLLFYIIIQKKLERVEKKTKIEQNHFYCAEIATEFLLQQKCREKKGKFSLIEFSCCSKHMNFER